MKKTSTFKDRLYEAILYSGLQQVDVADRAGISKSLLNKYLKGVSEAGNEKLYNLSQALNVSPVWLMGYDVARTREEDLALQDEKNKINQFINNLGEESLNKLKSLLVNFFGYEDL